MHPAVLKVQALILCLHRKSVRSRLKGSAQETTAVTETGKCLSVAFTTRLIFNVDSIVGITIVVIEDLHVITNDVIMIVESVAAVAVAIVVTRCTDRTNVDQIVKIGTTTESLDLGIAPIKGGLTIGNESTMRTKSESTRNNDAIKRGGLDLSSLCPLVTSFSGEGIIPLCT